MHRHLWRALAVITAVLAGLLVGVVPASATSGWQPAWNQSAAKQSARANRAWVVTNDEFVAVTDGFPACRGWTWPDLPDSVKADMAADKAPSYFDRLPNVTASGNGSPLTAYRTRHPGAFDLYVNGMWIVAHERLTVYRAWVQDFRGTGCDTWTQIQTTVRATV